MAAIEVGRYAPSPSGRMHLGNLSCCLLAWLSAKSAGGRVVLRIEDLDPVRCPRSFADLLERPTLHGWAFPPMKAGPRAARRAAITRASAAKFISSFITAWRQRGWCIPVFAAAASFTQPVPPTAATGR